MFFERSMKLLQNNLFVRGTLQCIDDEENPQKLETRLISIESQPKKIVVVVVVVIGVVVVQVVGVVAPVVDPRNIPLKFG